MTPLEYVEVLAVEESVYDARKHVIWSSTQLGGARRDKSGKPYYLRDQCNWKRYVRAMDEALYQRGIGL